ncbi:hypothetical protein RHGRI_037223 [Rhododendron griersonianum]|uniref:RRM domain-containing protein n=1 Tax=Rhododendron griersonianum TaxID=479676 RepID=A0AAV6HTT9_9ERIC|nr:hypothetical protein RHGRI_037223 [Rhododendron griersonianum]
MNMERSQEIFTLYVDNIPEHNDQTWLKRTFNKFGEVKDAFIPRKRSKRMGNKFGFVRYNCYAATTMAISCMNGVWVENERLFVKEASFEFTEETKHFRTPSLAKKGFTQGAIPIKRSGKESGPGISKVEFHGRSTGINMSFAQALKGESSKTGADQMTKLKFKLCGNGGLHRSAVAVMQRVMSMKTLSVSFSIETNRVAQFRSLGGRAVLITFQNQEVRDELLQR